MLLDRRAKWPQRIPFSRSTVVTFGGPKFLTLQITSTRKRKSAVYFVCGQSGTSPSPLLVRVRCWWSAVERFIESFLPPLDFTAPIIISVQAKTARSAGPLRIPKIKTASCLVHFFHQRVFQRVIRGVISRPCSVRWICVNKKLLRMLVFFNIAWK